MLRVEDRVQVNDGNLPLGSDVFSVGLDDLGGRAGGRVFEAVRNDDDQIGVPSQRVDQRSRQVGLTECGSLMMGDRRKRGGPERGVL